MPSVVHYKFRNAAADDARTISFDGPYIPINELKKRIAADRRFDQRQREAFDLQITDAETGDDYDDRRWKVGRDKSVVVRRIPLRNTTTTMAGQPVANRRPFMLPPKSKPKPDEGFGQSIFGGSQDQDQSGTEDDRLTRLINRSSAGYDTKSATVRQPHPNYVCYRCSVKGHFIQNCPTIGDPAFDGKRYAPPNPSLRPMSQNQFIAPVDDAGRLDAATNNKTEPIVGNNSRGFLTATRDAAVFADIGADCLICDVATADPMSVDCCGRRFCALCIINVRTCPSCKSVIDENSMRMA